MALIFLSYDSHDRHLARRIVGQLEAEGWSVWWDRRIQAGKPWRAALDQALNEMHCMVVLWSAQSIQSDWVIEEAEEGRARGRLLPILIEDVSPPRGFRQLQALSLVDWDGSAQAECFGTLLHDLRAITGDVQSGARKSAEPFRQSAPKRPDSTASDAASPASSSRRAGKAQRHATREAKAEAPRRSWGMARKLAAAVGTAAIAGLVLTTLSLSEPRSSSREAGEYAARRANLATPTERPRNGYERAVDTRLGPRPDGERTPQGKWVQTWSVRSYDSERGWTPEQRWRSDSDSARSLSPENPQVVRMLSGMQDELDRRNEALRPSGVRQPLSSEEVERARQQLERSRAAKDYIDSVGR